MIFHFLFLKESASLLLLPLLLVPYKIKLHADGNLTSKLIEQYSAAGCQNIILQFYFLVHDSDYEEAAHPGLDSQ
jgi:hypothetical protein